MTSTIEGKMFVWVCPTFFCKIPFLSFDCKQCLDLGCVYSNVVVCYPGSVSIMFLNQSQKEENSLN